MVVIVHDNSSVPVLLLITGVGGEMFSVIVIDSVAVHPFDAETVTM
jgi:hypothetical protein